MKKAIEPMEACSDETGRAEFSRLLNQRRLGRMDEKQVMIQGSSGHQTPSRRCPACGIVGSLTADAERGELFCNGCGTVFEERESVHGSETERNHSMPNLGLGELAPRRAEHAAITDHPTGKTESNIITAQYSDGEREVNEIRAMAESAARWLTLPRNAEVLLTENAVRRGGRLLAMLRAGKKRVCLEKLTAYALLSEAKKLGKSIEEVQSALAKAQFKIPLALITVQIATANPEQVKFYLAADSPQAQQPVSFKMSRTKDEDTRTVELVRAYNLEGYQARTIKLNLELCDVLAAKANENSFTGGKFILGSENALIRDGGKLVSSSPLHVNPSKCFALFKRAENLAREEASDDIAVRAAFLPNSMMMSFSAGGLDVEKFTRARLPSKFPISSMMMKDAGCLKKMEVEYMNAVKRLMSSTENIGRTPSRLMLEALRSADRSVFQSLSPEVTCRLGIKAAKLGLLGGRKKKHASFSSFLIAGEVR
jgi:uncharacterized Zn finger protein (UPF0148 family)